LEGVEGPSCKLAEPLTFDENAQDMDADAQRPHNNKFLQHEDLDDVDSFDEDDKTLTPPLKSPADFDIEDL
jgi:hypothetical protein